MYTKEDIRNVLAGLIFVSIIILPAYSATSVNSCIDINDSGSYTLTKDILDNTTSPCIKIMANNVDFDGSGFTIDGIEDANSVGVQAGTNYTNITVRNLTVTDWFYGISYNGTSSGVITRIIAISNNIGINLTSSNNNTLVSNILMSNIDYGISLSFSSDNIIYNNHFNNTNNFKFDVSNTWNTTKIEGTNISAGSSLGGNYWAYPNGTGFSQVCTDMNGDDICDSPYTLNVSNIDYLPLAKIPDLVITQENISFLYLLSEV